MSPDVTYIRQTSRPPSNRCRPCRSLKRKQEVTLRRAAYAALISGYFNTRSEVVVPCRQAMRAAFAAITWRQTSAVLSTYALSALIRAVILPFFC